MIHIIFGPRKKAYRQMTAPVPARIIEYYPTSKAIGPILNSELKDVHTTIRQRKEKRGSS